MSYTNDSNKLQPAKPAPSFYLGEVINHKKTDYEVIGLLSKGKLHMENLTSGQRFKLSPEDGLYKQLVKLKQEEEIKQEKTEKIEPGINKSAEQIKRTIKR